MARIDDYLHAQKIALELLSKRSFEIVKDQTGFVSPDPFIFQVPFLDREYRVNFVDGTFSDMADGQREVPIQEQVLILHYMLNDSIAFAGSEKWVAYREIKGASFYYSAFVKRAIDPLKKVFGNNLDGLAKSAQKLQGDPIDQGDVGYDFKLFPKITIRIILYAGDDEFPAEAVIVFQRAIESLLLAEDIAWLAGMLVYRLIALAH